MLTSLSKSVLSCLPAIFRKKIIRAGLPDFETNMDGITFRRAYSVEEYKNCFRLLHDVYVKAEFIKPSCIPLRIVPHHKDPESRVFMGCEINNRAEKTPIYTASLFPDNEQGLPMDTGFKRQVDVLRNKGRRLVEVGCLASHPLHRKGNKNIPMLGNRLILSYAIQVLHADDLLITVHPKYLKIYKDILLFEEIGRIHSYSYVNENPAVALRLNLNTVTQRFKKTYSQMPAKKNLHQFFFKSESTSIAMPLENEKNEDEKNVVKRHYGADMIDRVITSYLEEIEAKKPANASLRLEIAKSLSKAKLEYVA